MKNTKTVSHAPIALVLASMLGATVAAPQLAHAAPLQVKWQAIAPRERKKLPAAVSARLPRGAETIHLGRLPIGPNGAPMLVHIWTAVRRPEKYSYWPMDQSPVCIDVFAQNRNSFNRTASAVYLSDDRPREVASLWLRPAKKEGPVVVLVGPSHTSTKYTLVTFAEGVGAEDRSKPRVQDLYQGGIGGGKTVQNFGVDSGGMLTVETESSLYGKTESVTVRRWNGYEFKAPEGADES
jgi:hypothetical protein